MTSAHGGRVFQGSTTLGAAASIAGSFHKTHERKNDTQLERDGECRFQRDSTTDALATTVVSYYFADAGRVCMFPCVQGPSTPAHPQPATRVRFGRTDRRTSRSAAATDGVRPRRTLSWTPGPAAASRNLSVPGGQSLGPLGPPGQPRPAAGVRLGWTYLWSYVRAQRTCVADCGRAGVESPCTHGNIRTRPAPAK
jgi:hypothetical protein